MSKYGHFLPLREYFNSQTVADLFIHHVAKLHGIPKSIISDCDKIFTSCFWQHLFHSMGTKLALSTTYHPQTDGQTEALNKCLEQYLRCFSFDQLHRWSKLLPWAEFWYNIITHTSTGMSPFKILYGRDPSSLIPYSTQDRDPPNVSILLQQHDQVLQQLKKQSPQGSVSHETFGGC